MRNPIARYMHWLHTRWPAGTVEKLPEVGVDGATSLPGVRIVGDLTGIPLLKFSADTGARAVQAIVHEADFARGVASDDTLDLAIVGGGVSGIAAALEARKHGLRFQVFEATEPFSTIVNFPKAKPIYTYPTDMVPAGDLALTATVKETLLEELEAQRRAAGIEPLKARIVRITRRGDGLELEHGDGKTMTRARRVILAIGRTGNYRKLGVPGEKLDKVYNRLYDPMEHAGKQALVVGGGDSALETAIALATTGAHVVLSYRNKEFSRPKPENLEKIQMLVVHPDAEVAVEHPTSERVTTAAGSAMRGDAPMGSLRLMLGSKVKDIRADTVSLQDAGGRDVTLPNDVVFAMIGREAPLDLFRRSGIAVRGEWRPRTWIAFGAFFAFCVFVYNWKASTALMRTFEMRNWFPFNVPAWIASWSAASSDPRTFLGTMAITLREPGFHYSLAYTLCIVLFGLDRMRRRRTPYVRAQTWTLMAFQVLPLFLLPYIILPWLGHRGAFDGGAGHWLADQLFPAASYGHGREYWRAFGFVLAWPLFIWNFFTEKPMWLWLAIGSVQTFVLIPLMVRRWGKGAYCGWVCSCGALAETMGDRHRHKMPHGPLWNRLNMVGQAILVAALLLFLVRIIGWSFPNAGLGHWATQFYRGMLSGFAPFGVQFNYYHVVDIGLAGIVGVAGYFWFSGRIWCRFACPLAALMHIYARFTRFRIFPEKKKCISCNVCTSVCHQGIDIMNFANKGMPMQDPECVRCSACVQMCPTGTLQFGRYGTNGRIVLDALPASPVHQQEA